MDGRAVAPAAGTVLNALATGTGSAFAIDLDTTASVTLRDDSEIDATIADHPDADTALVERCVEVTLEHYAERAGLTPTTVGADVHTESEVPIASGLKSSSAAANATVLATLDALEIADTVDRITACRLGVQAARDAGVTVTGAFDDASASMLGGVTVTDNTADDLLVHDTVEWDALVYTPPKRSFSADADVSNCERIAPMADLVAELAQAGRYGEAMTVNGFAFCSALGFSTDPMLEVLPDVEGVSLSGTGSSFVALGEREQLQAVRDRWDQRDGTTRLLATRTDGTRTT